MKSYNHLFEKLVDFDNIYTAIMRASKGKRNRPDVKKVITHIKIKCYVRYVDDFIMFHQNKKDLHKAFDFLHKYLKTIHLKIKGNYQVYKFAYDKNGKEYGRAIDFMGFKFYRNRVALRRSIMLKAVRKALKMGKQTEKNWFECTQLISYLGWFKHTDTYKVYEKYVQPNVNLGECKNIVSLHSYRLRRKENDIKLENSRKFGSAS